MMVTTSEYIDYSTAGDAGLGITFRCPVCSSKLNLATSQWWEVFCDCGYEWKLELKAVGKK